MKTLLILRHAKSSWDDEHIADHARPLASRGKGDAPRMGEVVRAADLVPDLIISSTAKRARETAKLVMETSGYGGDLRLEDDFYMAGPEDYLEVLQLLPDVYTRVMIVGHNPGLEMLLEMFTGEWERLPTAALAEVRLRIARWEELDEDTEGALVHLWTPRAVG